MEVIFALVGITVVLVIVIAAVLLWAVRAGQFEDLEGPAWRVVMDDDRPARGDGPAAHGTEPGAGAPGERGEPENARRGDHA